MNLLLIFIGLSIVNVVLNTLKTTITVKGGKFAAATINAITFFVYTYVIIYTNCELSMHLKAIITGAINFVGVYIVKWVEEKARKDKLWKIEATFPHKENFVHNLDVWAKVNKIPMNYIDIDKYYIVNFYSATQNESLAIKEFITKFDGKYFASETKML